MTDGVGTGLCGDEDGCGGHRVRLDPEAFRHRRNLLGRRGVPRVPLQPVAKVLPW
jgi:hypothetical protein